MQIHQLSYILEVAKVGSMNKAAQNLFISQPNLSQAISNLEQELGVAIFKRHNKGVSVTAEGKVVIKYARSIMEQINHIKYLTTETITENEAIVKISHSRSLYLAEAIMNIYNQYDRFSQFSVNITGVPDVIKDVCKMKSEIGFLVVSNLQQDLFEKMLEYKELDFIKIGESKLCLVVGENSSLINYKSVKVTDFSNLTHVGYIDESNSTNKYNVDLDENWWHFDAKTISVTDLVTMRELLNQIDSYTFDFLDNQSYLERNGLTCLPLHDEMIVNIGYIKRKNDRLSMEAHHFITEVEKKYGYKF